jgi:NlpC/P60 family putative phage cell wall peptidase
MQNLLAPAAYPSRVIALARAWIGTPYLHQASLPGVGADCLGLARGIWRALHGDEPFRVPPYSRDWGEAGAREVLYDAACQFLIEVPIGEVGPGTLMLFRMAPGAPAKHCGILGPSITQPSLIHAYDRSGVVEEPFSAAWSRRAVYAFLFPAERFDSSGPGAAAAKVEV